MQIRERGGKIHCVRTIYDKGRGRGRTELVATLSRFTERLPADGAGLEKLTEDEREQLAAWVAKAAEARQKLHDRYAANTVTQKLQDVARLIGEGQELSQEQADGLWQAMALVGKALRKAKYLKPKPGATDDQGDDGAKK